MTFVVLQKGNAAPQSTPVKNSPVQDKSSMNQDPEDFYPVASKKTLMIQFGGIAGAFGDNDGTSWHYQIGAFKKYEFAFEKTLIWGATLISNQTAELHIQSDFTSLFSFDPFWSNYGMGASQFMWGQDGISNLVNINQSKVTLYADLGDYFQAQAYIGLKGVAYSLSFQSWF